MTERDIDPIVDQLERWARQTEDALPRLDADRITLTGRSGPRRMVLLAAATILLVAGGAALVWRLAAPQSGTVITATSPTAEEASVPPSPGTPSTLDPRSLPTTPAAVVTMLPAGAWTGARTTAADDRAIVIAFTGAASFVDGDPCTASYSAGVAETPSEVRITIREMRTTPAGDVGCPDIGYEQTVIATLGAPLGERVVVNDAAGTPVPVFDGRRLLEPPGLPATWALISQTTGYPNPETAWTRTWGTPSAGCTPHLALTQGDPSVASFNPYGPDVTIVDVAVRGSAGRLQRDDTLGVARLTWTEGDQGFALETRPTCDSLDQASDIDLVAFADALTEPQPDAASDDARDASSPTSAVTTSPPSSTARATPTADAADAVTLGPISLSLPYDAIDDPRPQSPLPDSVTHRRSWVVPDVASLNVTIQSTEPRFPSDQLLDTFQSNGLVWQLYDIGPRNGSVVTAVTELDAQWIAVSAQGWTFDRSVVPRTYTEQLARTIQQAPP